MQKAMPDGARKSRLVPCALIAAFSVIALVTTIGCQIAPSLSGGSSGPYTVKFDAGNAAAPAAGITYALPASKSVAAGTKLVLPARNFEVTPGAGQVALPDDASTTGSVAGAYFIGWTKTARPATEATFADAVARLTTEAGGSPGEAITVNSDMTLYAVYVTTTASATEKVGKVVLNKNFTPDVTVIGWPDAYTSFVAAGQKIAPYSALPIQRPGFDFAGWSTELDRPTDTPAFVATKYQSGTPFVVGTLAGGNFAVYAHWTDIPNKVKIIYHRNGATAGTDPVEGVQYGNTQAMPVLSLVEINSLAAIDWVNGTKTIRGWAKTADGVVAYQPGETIKSDTDVDLYAIWANAYTVTLLRDNVTGMVAGQYPNAPTLGPTFGAGPAFTIKYFAGDDAIKLTAGNFATFASIATTTGYTVEWGTRTGAGGAFAALESQTEYTPIADVTFYVRFTGKVFTLSIDSNGGTIPTPYVASSDAKWGEGIGVTIPAQVKAWIKTDRGYLYGGLAHAASDTSATATPGAPTATPALLPADVPAWVPSVTDSYSANKTLYVFWAGRRYDVFFLAGDGGSGTQNGMSGKWPTPVTLPTTTNFTKANCTFVGWMFGTTDVVDLDSATTGLQWKPATYPADVSPPAYLTINLTAKWAAQRYTVSYNANGGAGTVPASSAVTDWGTAVTLAAGSGLTKDGYSFGGWSTTATGTALSGTTWTPTGSFSAAITLYAVWTAKTYTISFVGGAASSGTQTAISGTWGTATALPATSTFTKAGYGFAGWSLTDGGAAVTSPWSPTGLYSATYTLYARWGGAVFTISFVGGTGSSGTQAAVTGNWGTATALPATSTITKDGYSFAGWSLTDGGTTALPSPWTAAAYAATYTLYAIWTGKPYTITYAYDGGTANAASTNPVSGIFGTDLTLDYIHPPTKSGYGFNGWTITGVTPKPEDITSSTGSWTLPTWAATITFTAKWVGNIYRVTFEGGTGSTGTQASILGTWGETPPALPNGGAVTFAKDGYGFLGWSETNGGETLSSAWIPTTYQGTYTIYAIWGGKFYAATFNVNGGTGTAPDRLTATIPAAITLPSGSSMTPPAGKTFSGWATSTTGNVITGNTWLPSPWASTTILYAIWK